MKAKALSTCEINTEKVLKHWRGDAGLLRFLQALVYVAFKYSNGANMAACLAERHRTALAFAFCMSRFSFGFLGCTFLPPSIGTA
jgi:hypothetical protein